MEPKQIKNLLFALGFTPQEGAKGMFRKEYSQFSHYAIEVNCDKQIIDYGNKIKCGSKRTQNFSKDENFVVLECVDRLLAKGYKPENIELEKIWPAGRGHSGELDICVSREGQDYLLIECKTYGKEFDKELANMREDGGQLFTYFKFSNTADLLMLYASQLSGNEVVYRNEIVKIEEEYRQGDVADFYDKWNKLTKNNGVFEEGREPYQYESRMKSITELDDINESNSEKLFYNFLKILRANAISDKPNAFNKVFNLFICKIYDEWHNENDGIAQFVWEDGDSPEGFMTRLTELYEKAIDKFLNKKVLGLRSLDDLNLSGAPEPFINEVKKLLVRDSNDFAILEIIDKNDFYKNTSVVKSIVQLFENLKIRYDKQNNHLSNFFEQLLTTGLKQEVGQFFTPIPITKFILRSIPLKEKCEELLRRGELPKIIDYAAGSGHFIHESMHAIQSLLDNYENVKTQSSATKEKISTWKSAKYSWADDSIYGIERDYRLSKVAKVGCYMHGDGVANIINGNGLDDFYKSKDYIKILKFEENDRDDNYKKFGIDNPVFDFVVSNPPFAVDDFCWSLADCKNSFAEGKHSFALYDVITDKTKEIECLFVERAKQLLKSGGAAGIILPSSILSNAGIYAKTREIILRYFEIVAITELGSGTFMATGTNTVVLFLRRRNDYDCVNLEQRVGKFFKDFQDVTIKAGQTHVETPVAKYLNYVWGDVKWDDYLSLLKREPNKSIRRHELYKEYEAKITTTDENFLDRVLATEKEKIFYFILAWPQRVVVVKSSDKETEKRFLGYEFSNRRGNEGIHPIQRGKTIDECTQLFDADPTIFENPEKASTYIYRAFTNPDAELQVPESLKNHVFKADLVDMMTFGWATVETKISLAVKKTVKVTSKWETLPIGNIAKAIRGVTYTKGDQIDKNTSKSVLTADNITLSGELVVTKEVFLREDFPFDEEKRLKQNDIFICFSSGSKTHVGKLAFIPQDTDYYAGGFMGILRAEKSVVSPKYLFLMLNHETVRDAVREMSSGSNIQNLSSSLATVKIPLPPLDVQAKIVKEIKALEKKESEIKAKVAKGKEQIEDICLHAHATYAKEKLRHFVETNPSKKEIADLNAETPILFVDMPSVSNDGYIRKRVTRQFSEVKKGSYTYFREGDIIIAKITPCMENGKCALATNLTNGLAMGSSEFHVFRANAKKIDAKYLFTLLNRKPVRIEAEKNMTGASGHRRVPIAFYENLEIPLPPLSEQRKIVAKIEKLENDITDLQKELESFSERKNAVLRKWL